jgi:dienelactone hydrolase
MSRLACLAGGLVLVAAASVPAADSPEPPAVLSYLGRYAERLAGALPPLPDTRDAWEKQRADLVQKLTAALGLPDREPMRAAVTYRHEAADRVREEVAFLWAERAYVSATVLSGKQAAGRRPAVVIPSGWLGHHAFQPYRKFVESLVRQGFVVLFCDDPRTGQRQSPAAGLYATAAIAGTSVAGIQVYDAVRGFDYLLTRPDVDPGKIGIAGYGEGALQAYLAAAVEPRFQFVVAVEGTTTYAAIVAAAVGDAVPEDPSAYVPGILRFTDMDRVAACAAPRPVLVAGRSGLWPKEGGAQVLRTMRAAYGLCGAEDRLRQLRGEPSGSIEPYVAETERWLAESVLPALKSSDAPPAACAPPQEPDFSMLRYLQRRIAAQAAPLATPPATESAWKTQRDALVPWLRTACGLDRMQPPADQVGEASASGDLITEPVALGVDADYRCPAVLVRPAAAGAKRGGVVLSHDDRGCAAAARLADAAQRLATAGYCVLVPDHASGHPQSRQTLVRGGQASFYGDDARRLHGPADAVGLPPLALRVAETLAAVRHLAGRPDVDPAKIVVAGLGIGGVDACLAAVLDERIAGVAAIDATTLRDWAVNAAPVERRFFHILPYLPAMLARADLDTCVAAVAPRPMVVVRLTDGWPRSGFAQVAATAAAVYKLRQADKGLLTLGPRDATEELEAAIPAGIQRQLIAVARTLVPTPPQSGIIGSADGLKSRATVDSAVGLIWLVSELGGYEQQFVGNKWRLDSWTFFNDNGAAQQGRCVTPLIFKKNGEQFTLVAIGKTRTNTGAGLQRSAFEPVAGTDEVGDDHLFGFYDGDPAGKPNAGVVEFEDAPDSLMVILTGDGQMDGQRLKLGAAYRQQSSYRRYYSIQAVSKKP